MEYSITPIALIFILLIVFKIPYWIGKWSVKVKPLTNKEWSKILTKE